MLAVLIMVCSKTWYQSSLQHDGSMPTNTTVQQCDKYPFIHQSVTHYIFYKRVTPCVNMKRYYYVVLSVIYCVWINITLPSSMLVTLCIYHDHRKNSLKYDKNFNISCPRINNNDLEDKPITGLCFMLFVIGPCCRLSH